MVDYATLKSDKLAAAYVYTDDAIKAAKGKIATGAKNLVTKAGGSKAGTAIKSAVKRVTKDDGVLGTAIKFMKQALGFLFEKLSKVCSKFGFKATESKLGISAIQKILTVTKLKPLADKISQFVASISAKTASSAGTLGLMEIGFIAYGALDGASNAGALFEVQPDDVDAKMRAIAAVFKGLMGTSIGSWVDLINSLVYELLGYSFVKTIATATYNFISGKKDDKKLADAQKQFTADYEAYVKKEYEAYVKKEKAAGRKPMSEEEFKASDKVTTRSDYNSKVNKSLATRVVDGVKWVGEGAKKVGSTVVGGVKKVGKAAKKLGSKIVNSKVAKGAAKVLNKGKEVVTGVAGKLADGVKDGIDAAKAIGTGFVKIAQNFYNKENSFMDFMKSDVNTLDDENMFKGLVGGVLNISKIFMFPKLLILGILNKVGKALIKAFSPVIEGAKNVGTNLVNGAPKIFSNAIGGKIIDFFTYKVDSNGDDVMSTAVSNVILNAEKALLTPLVLTSAAVRKVAEHVGPVVEGIKTVGGNLIDGVPAIFSNAIGGKVLEFFTYSADSGEGDSPIATGISNVILNVEKTLLTPIALTSAAVRKVVGFLSPVIDGAKEVGSDLIKGVPKIAKYAVTGKFENFFKYRVGKDEDTGISAHVANAVMNVEKSLLMPVAMVTGGIRKIGSLLGESVKGVADFGSKTIKFVKTLSSYTNPKKDMSGWKDETITGDKDDVVSTVVSTVVKSIMWKYVSIIRHIRSAFSWVGDIGDLASDTYKKVKGKVGDAVDWVGDKASGALDWVGDKANGLVTGVMDFARGGKDGGRPIYGKGGEEDYYYSQNDPRYKNKKYRQTGGNTSVDDTMGESGCGPTAMAMVASKMTNKEYNPMDMAKLAEAGGYSTSMGTSPEYFSNAANTLGIPNRVLSPSYENLQNSLSLGNSIILQGVKSSGMNSPFTSEGHYVVVNGLNNGKVLVSDPRGREYSGLYNLKDVMTDTTGMWSFGGGKGNKKSARNLLKRFARGGKGGDVDKWIAIIRSVKRAIADQKPGYSQTNYINITIDGKTLRVRTDCSGFVAACLKYFGVLGENVNLTSTILTNRDCNEMKDTGFTAFSWPGWDNLMEGDIMALNGHTEIFAYNKDGGHYVYNCGSDSSVNSAEPCYTAHKEGYTTIWRCDASNQFMNSKQISNTGTGDSLSSGSSSSSGGVTSISELFSGAASAFTDSIMQSMGLKSSSDSSSYDTTSQTTGGNVDAINVSGSDNAEKLWNYFKSLGYSDAAVAAILGNAQQESNFNPESGKNGGDAHGIFQWEGGRFTALQNHANSMGKEWYTIEPQMSYLASELTNPDIAYFNKNATYGSDVGHGAAGKTNWEVAGANKTTYEEWKQSTDVDMATRQFEAAVERASWPRMENRIGYAKGFYDKYAGGKGGEGGDGGRPIVPVSEYRGKVTPSSSSSMRSDSPRISSIVEKNIVDNSMSSKETSQLLNTMINYLSIIVDNTGDTSDGIKDLNKKDFGTSNNITNNNVSANNISESSKDTTTKQNNPKPDRSGYNMAKRIAAGILT